MRDQDSEVKERCRRGSSSFNLDVSKFQKHLIDFPQNLR